MASKKNYGWITGAGAAGMLGWLTFALVPGLGIARIIGLLKVVPQGVAVLKTAKSLWKQRSQNPPNNAVSTRP